MAALISRLSLCQSLSRPRQVYLLIKPRPATHVTRDITSASSGAPVDSQSPSSSAHLSALESRIMLTYSREPETIKDNRSTNSFDVSTVRQTEDWGDTFAKKQRLNPKARPSCSQKSCITYDLRTSFRATHFTKWNQAQQHRCLWLALKHLPHYWNRQPDQNFTSIRKQEFKSSSL